MHGPHASSSSWMAHWRYEATQAMMLIWTCSSFSRSVRALFANHLLMPSWSFNDTWFENRSGRP